MTFHTLERVKADTFEGESEDRAFQEAAIFACADAVLASCEVEAEQFVRFYNAERLPGAHRATRRRARLLRAGLSSAGPSGPGHKG